MLLTIIRSAPDLSSFTPLSTHQTSTPASFQIPVLHFRSENSRVTVSKDQVSLLPIFGDNASAASGDSGEGERGEVTTEGFDVYVTSQNLILYNTPLSVGVTLPYQSITLHAIQPSPLGPGIYIQLALSPSAALTSNTDSYDHDDSLELSIFPVPVASSTEVTVKELTEAFYKALSDCANLNPDPTNEGSSDEEQEDPIFFEDGNGDIGGGGARLEGFPEGLGSGWITVDNVDQFQFADASEEGGVSREVVLGPGAGTVRLREDKESDEKMEEEGPTGGDVEEVKWRRTG